MNEIFLTVFFQPSSNKDQQKIPFGTQRSAQISMLVQLFFQKNVFSGKKR